MMWSEMAYTDDNDDTNDNTGQQRSLISYAELTIRQNQTKTSTVVVAYKTYNLYRQHPEHYHLLYG